LLHILTQVGDAQAIIYTIFIYWGGAFYTYPKINILRHIT